MLLTLIITLNVRELPFARIVGPMAGFVVGVVMPSFGVGGPLIALFLLTRNWSRQATRASMAFSLLMIDVVSVVGYGVAGLYTQERLVLILVVIVPVIAGTQAWRISAQAHERADISSGCDIGNRRNEPNGAGPGSDTAGRLMK